MIDQPMRGRSAAHPGDGPTRMFTATNEEWQFTAIENEARWPQAKLHTQWPGEGPNKGRKGDPIFDAFYGHVGVSSQRDSRNGRYGMSDSGRLLASL